MSLSWIDAGALAITVALFYGIHRLRRAGASFALLTLAALAVGAGVGVVLRGHTSYIDPIGDIYVQVITAAVIPLIAVSILSSVTALGSVTALRTIGLSSTFWLLLSNAVAIILTLGLALALGLGRGVGLDIAGIDGGALTGLLTPFDEVLASLFPSNLAGDVQGNRIIPVILAAGAVAVAYLLVARDDAARVAPLRSLVEALKAVIFKVVGFIISATPYAVLALTATSTSTAVTRLSTVWSLAVVLGATIIASLVHMYLVNGVLLRVFADVSPLGFFRKIAPAQLTAFTTQSSVGTLPLTTGALTGKVGVPEQVAHFTAPLGTTIGMPGCAGIWPIIVAVFGINALGIDYGVRDYALLAALCLVVSLGTAGVPGTAIITATAVLNAAGLPVEVMVLLIPINAVAGTFSTSANVTAAAVSAAIVARRRGELDDRVFAGGQPLPDAPAHRGPAHHAATHDAAADGTPATDPPAAHAPAADAPAANAPAADAPAADARDVSPDGTSAGRIALLAAGVVPAAAAIELGSVPVGACEPR